jgi:toxin ParE1/3/4
MSSRVRLRPEAELDAVGAASWYEEKRAGLGHAFLAALDEALQRVGSSPQHFPQLQDGVRRARLRRFPYGVYFVLEPERSVVIAVLHLHRDPDLWRARSEGGPTSG